MTHAADAAGMRVSQKGWATVAYNRTLWIPNLPVLPDGYDIERWAREFAATWWSISGLPHGVNEIARLEAQLAYLGDNTYGQIACHEAFIHLPDPRMTPLPVYLAILEAGGERSERLRMLSAADDPNLVRRPIIEEFSTERLGAGLKVLRHFTDAAGAADLAAGREPEVYGGLSYAWRSEEFQTDLRLFTAVPDLGRLQGAIPDIDELARQITVMSNGREE